MSEQFRLCQNVCAKRKQRWISRINEDSTFENAGALVAGESTGSISTEGGAFSNTSL
jgi:hypothetical protein